MIHHLLIHVPTTAVYMVKTVYGCEYGVLYIYTILLGILVYCILYKIVHRLVFILREIIIYGLGYFGKILQGLTKWYKM